MTNILYFKVCPRGFANEVTYYTVTADKVSEVEAEYGNYTDTKVDDGGYAEWTTDTDASIPGVAVPWADRQ